VTDRVTGIVGGCLCPANPLLPRVSSGPTAPSSDSKTEVPLCPCDKFRGEDTTGQAIDDPSTQPPKSDPKPAPDPEKPSPSLGDTVTGTVNGVTDTVNNLIDEALEGTPLEPLVPDAPVPSVTPIQLPL